MNPSRLLLSLLLASLSLTTLPSGAAGKTKFPATSFDGLVLAEKSRADALYLAPGAKIPPYSAVILQKAHVAFHEDWQEWYNRQAPLYDQITSEDMTRMIAGATELFMTAFAKELEKRGYPVVEEPGDGVVLIRPAIVNIQVTVPDPDGTKRLGGSNIHAGSAGSMTFFVELYDSVSGRILARAIDVQDEINEGWAIPRNYSTNKNAARRTFEYWADRLAEGLDEVKNDPAKAESDAP